MGFKKIAHIIENQYIKHYLINTKCTVMYDLPSIYDKVYTYLKTHAEDCFDFGENSRFYPKCPTLTELEIISLAITAECVQMDSESLFWSKLIKDYSHMFATLPHRTTFNRRWKVLTEAI